MDFREYPESSIPFLFSKTYKGAGWNWSSQRFSPTVLAGNVEATSAELEKVWFGRSAERTSL